MRDSASQWGIKFHENLRLYRKATGMSAKAFATQALNMHYTTYIAYENDEKREPTLTNLCRIARALNISIDDLLGYKPPAKCKSVKNQLFNKKLKEAMNALADVIASTEAEGEC